MKRTLALLTGVATLLVPVMSAIAAPSSLYERIKDDVKRQYESEEVEPEIRAFIHEYMESVDQDVSENDVNAAVNNKIWEICGRKPTSDPNKTFQGCDNLVSRIKNMVQNEQRVRVLGRSLQLVATSYELPISDLPNRSLQFSQSLRGIVSIWSAGTGSIKFTTSGAQIRTKAVDDTAMQPLLTSLATELNALSTEERIAAVWRYQYGVRLVKDERAPRFPAPYIDGESAPGTERQYFFKDWDGTDGIPDVEQKLMDIWDEVVDDTFTPPLAASETVLYIFPKDMLKDTMPDNIIVWARMDGPPAHPFGDVGLQWQVPLEPVLPSLMWDDEGDMAPILGGTYPPNPERSIAGVIKPVDGDGLCTDPVQIRGYLCRPFIQKGSKDLCPDDPENPIDPLKISLVTCTGTGSLRATIAGADVCRDVNYRIQNTFNPNTQCKIEIKCETTCGGSYAAQAKGKDGTGTIKICMSENPPGGATYLLFHELHHAYQDCTGPIDSDPDDAYTDMDQFEANRKCCHNEGEAYRANCDILEQDGVFAGTGIDAQSCAEAFTNDACIADTGLGCFTSRTYPPSFRAQLFAAIGSNPKNVPTTCTDAMDPKKMDLRIKDLIGAVQRRKDVCAPGQVELYKNRIGNNLCYIGQCVEESLEMHRTTGAQSPATVQDEGYPWNDPQTGSAFGNAVLNPPIAPTHLPTYKPLLIVEEMEQKLCQQQGLPPLTPSILCTYNKAAQRQHPVIDQISNSQLILLNAQEDIETRRDTLSLSLALGSRIGTTMYAEYLGNATRALADVLNVAVRLFKEMIKIDFPTQMCPTDDTLPPPPPAPSSSSGQ
jgi:hypothetical protein